MPGIKSFLVEIQKRAFAPVDIASLVFFRIVFGGLLVWDSYRYFFFNRIPNCWILPRLLFKYYGLSWVQPWPGNGMYIHWAVLGLLTFFIAIGFLYRASIVLYCIGYTYTFLLDEGTWVNHTYLICLLSFLMIFAPAHRAFSVDVWLRPKLRSETTPAWILWLLRTQMGVVYFFSGVAKLSSDWLHGEPLRTWLPKLPVPAIIRGIGAEWTVYCFSYTGLLLDLFVVPLLLWRRTRVAAFCVALVFHLLNAHFFFIGIFPWLAIAGTTLFFSPDWPRRVLSIFRVRIPPAAETEQAPPRQLTQIFVLAFVAVYIAIQILVPLRPFLYRGGVEWISAEHRFCWRMMLLDEWIRSNFYVTDPNSGEEFHVRPEDYLLSWQIRRMGWRPDMLVQFAQYLAKVMPRSGPKPLRVEARIFVSLNGRKPQLFIDQNVDLAAEERPLGRPKWLLEIHEPRSAQPTRESENPFVDKVDEN